MDNINQLLDQFLLAEYIIIAVILVFVFACGVLWYFIHQAEKKCSEIRHSLGQIQDELNDIQKEYKKIQEEISRAQEELDETESAEERELSQRQGY